MTNERLRQSIEQLTKDTAAERIKRREAMDNLIAQDADLIDIGTEMVVEVTEDDRGAAAQYDVVEAFARHRKYGYDQGYYDGRKMDAMEERAKIVAWLRSEQISTEKLRDEMNRHTAGWHFADEHASSLEQSAAAIERGEHMQEQSR
jgi:hypothetical protein